MADKEPDVHRPGTDQSTSVGSSSSPWAPSDGSGTPGADQPTWPSGPGLRSPSEAPIPVGASSNSTLLKVIAGMTASFLVVAVAILGVVLINKDEPAEFRPAVTTPEDAEAPTPSSSTSPRTQPTDEDDQPSDNSLIDMKGTTPLVELNGDFLSRIRQIEPTLVNFNYSAESYDAAIVIGLAAEAAGSDGSDMARRINDITRDGEKCNNFESCTAILDAGGDPDYDGVSGPLEFSGNGEPTQASYGVLQFGSEGCEETSECIDESKTQFVAASAPRTLTSNKFR